MPEPARREDVISIADYLRETIREIDDYMASMARRREGLAIRLAVLEAASDPDVRAAAADYRRRVEENRPYETARPAEDVLSEAHSRFIP